ncbi:synaptic glycoprotein SC2-like protein [Cavenderia fasciculata]|uniref:very-long-chain enoyl-CoA reductase n=1 Tax=Cavenderia fasciculata TaxID=261658 RepID=F4PG78_CACFS|nr:synaptic glycoprotein SC2-like protein [Cavenderia fasciculata]EGG24712.1 synaptic glycoprotein SC2-like protein [Cavenderia fasciculata]|eukprot:XP_004362563.1 synaptic glycoprotein SC2-like protein [Cavenderia fasciculata]
MKITIVSGGASKRTICELELSTSTTIKELKKSFAQKNPKYYVDRQRFVTSQLGPDNKPIVLSDDNKTLSHYKITSDNTLVFKDLGPQVSWTTVFLTEYAGPLLIYPIFYFFGQQIYGQEYTHGYTQQYALLCYSLHYIKRLLETIFVHRFSHATMPISNIFKNSIYYWGNTILVSYFVNHPLFTSPPPARVLIGLCLWVVGELFNLISHIQLRNLRPAGSTVRQIPKGLLFEYVSCPNYTMEILAWIGFSIMTQTLTAYVFTVLGAVQMYVWAVAKHRRYRKEFDGKNGELQYPRNRKIIVPFLL